ncbi:hypothetical protein ACFLVE_03845 [Chloroflexota bacterium]
MRGEFTVEIGATARQRKGCDSVVSNNAIPGFNCVVIVDTAAGAARAAKATTTAVASDVGADGAAGQRQVA